MARSMPPKLKTALDFGPLLIFLGAFYLTGKDMIQATIAVMVAVILSLIIAFIYERRFPPIPLFTAAIFMFMGGLTVYLDDPKFVMMKPTIVYIGFAAILLGGVLFKKHLLQLLMGEQLNLPEFAWRVLTIRFAAAFLVMALANEIARRQLSEAAWINFKVFGLTILMFLFSITQAPYISKHFIIEKDDEEEPKDTQVPVDAQPEMTNQKSTSDENPPQPDRPK